MSDQVEHVAFRSAIAFTTALKGVSFPASKSDLVKAAERNNTPHDTLEIMKQMPDGTYDQMADVTHNLPRALQKAKA